MELNNQDERIALESDPAIERRQYSRVLCKPPFPVSFGCAEGRISAYVDDINRGGAKLRVPYANSRIPFLIQGEFDYTFHTEVLGLLNAGRVLPGSSVLKEIFSGESSL